MGFDGKGKIGMTELPIRPFDLHIIYTEVNFRGYLRR
jgi:hypothetical protein